ncbi:MAG: hypothetical protein NZ561_09945, partial [Phycisphaerae bacterium]|nr:hypothetical protein [Phycisphaerae bacterium]
MLRKPSKASLALLAAAHIWAATCLGQISFQSGSVTFTHFRNGNSASSAGSFNLPMSSAYSHTFADSASGANTKGIGTVTTVTNSTTATFTLASGTGVTESDPAKVWPSPSRLRIDLNDLRWNIGANGFGPTATAYLSLTVAGVIGSGGTGAFIISGLSFRDGAGNVLTSTGTLGTGATFNFGPGSFSQQVPATPFNKLLTAPSLGAGTQFRIGGTLEFQVNNDETPTLLEPVAIDLGAAPPTARFDTDQVSGTIPLWTNPQAWSADDTVVPGIVPDRPGDRALFMPSTNSPRNRFVLITAPITVGTVDVNDPSGSGMSIVADGNGSAQQNLLNFRTLPAGSITQSSVLHHRNSRGSNALQIAAPVVLHNPLDAHIDSARGTTLSSSVTAAPGVSNSTLTKRGSGRLTLSGPLAISGLNVEEGEVELVDSAVATAPPVIVQPGGRLRLRSSGTVEFLGGIELPQGPVAQQLAFEGNVNVSTGLQSGNSVILDVGSGGQATFLGPNNNTGQVHIRWGTVQFDSAGHMNQVSTILMDGSLRATTNSAAPVNRIGNSAVIHARGGELAFSGNGSETYGPTIIDGGSLRMTLQSPAGGLTITSQQLSWQNQGVLFLAGDNLGSVAGSRLLLNSPPTLVGGGGPPGSTTISILPYASGASSSSATFGTSLLTYEAVRGLRPLNDATEYLDTFSGATPQSNLRLSSSQNLPGAQAINALVLMPGVSITGSSTLTVNSG